MVDYCFGHKITRHEIHRLTEASAAYDAEGLTPRPGTQATASSEDISKEVILLPANARASTHTATAILGHDAPKFLAMTIEPR